MNRRHLGKVVAGAAVAVTAAAALVAVSLPGEASGDAQSPGVEADNSDQARQRPGVVAAAPPERAKGEGRDPLTDDELERARGIALGRGLRSGGEDVRGKPGPQQIATDLAEPAPAEVGAADPPRRADVTFYDYKDDAYITKTVDLASGKVERTDTQHGVQPPPTREEVAEAARLLIADPLGDGLRKDYQDATGRTLTGPGQLTVTGFVYRVDAENPGPDRLADCGRHRCVRLFTRVENGPWIDTRQLVVDLSDRKVARLA
ncbi:Tat pathway signal sequence domain protein [Streptomyces sp. XD-27]|uniref:Tat pathway signal sequence domain protein n=1 Tax=Streptomyces sp. XD-27 TaxID=3062779 RepID=UPI0026F476AA|nr:Tat pathway signal sequence domain protein [Streptomyces sp. XD-27]WKX74491.1 Tat pathway signal sequence domain protein [Streptomyces sp. XD-27]